MAVGGLLCVGAIMGKLSGEYIRMDVIIPLGISGIIGPLIGGKLTRSLKKSAESIDVPDYRCHCGTDYFSFFWQIRRWRHSPLLLLLL